MSKPFVTTRARLVRSIITAAVIGLLAGAGAMRHYLSIPVIEVDPRMDKFCRWPVLPGEAMFAGLDREGVLYCWDMRQ